MLQKYLFLFVINFWCTFCWAQTINFEDGFEDGDFSNNPVWSGDAADFLVAPDTPNFQLQLDASGTGPSYLSTPSTNTVGSWEFYVAFDGFEPSGSNKAEVFLMSDISDLNGPVNGYVLRAGESGDDVFRIVRYDDGTETAIILSDTTVITSNGGGYRIKVTRSSIGNWKLEVGTGYQGSLEDSGNTGTDNTYSSSDYFGVKVNFTSSRSDKFFFDFKIDLPPFTIENIWADGNAIDITFNRPYDETTVQVSDFSVDKSVGTPSSINFTDASNLRLIYDMVLPSNRYTISVNNINDTNDQTIETGTLLNLIIYGILGNGDVVVNEFMYDPPLGLAEYVELKNTSQNYLNIKDWQLGDQNGIGIITTDTVAFAPDSFLVISMDTSALFSQFGPGNYLQVSSGSFPSLNNGGDAIRILTGNDDLIDSLFYNPGWGGEDVALERRSATAPSSKMANWGDSPQGIGTPGRTNQILSDISPPVFLNLDAVDETTLQLHFSEELKSVTASEAANYTITPNTGIQTISARNDTVTLFLTQRLEAGQTYHLSVSNLEDIFGNAMGTSELETTFQEFSSPRYRDIVINEIQYTRTDAGAPEFVELYNTSGKNFDLSRYKIGDSTGMTLLPESIKLLAGEYLVLTTDVTFAASLPQGLHIAGLPSFNDSGDAVYLQTGDGTVIDTLRYSQSWSRNLDGRSLERKDPLAASNDAANWNSSNAQNGHTAGKQNSIFHPDETSPNITFAKLIPNNLVAITFSEFIRPTSQLQFISGDAHLAIASFDSLNANKIQLKIPSQKPIDLITTIAVQNLSDVKGNTAEELHIPIARPIIPGDVVINEIMYNPLVDDDDNQPDQSEYVELLNTRNFAISLEGIFFHDAADEDGEIRPLIPVSTQDAWIPANGYVLIYADEEPVFSQSRLAEFFDLEAEITPTPIRIDRATLSLASSDDAIFLSDSMGVAIDSVFYDENWGNPNLIDTRGIALERIDPSGPSDNPVNWSSSTTPRGGTPGSENSIFQIASNTPEQTGLSFSPNPFSPDDDGNDDNLFINYKLNEPDYLLRARIYDRYGRLIKNLADGTQAGFEGSLLWDGRKNDGSKNRIGIYIVVFEAFNSANGKDLAFKETVVLARRLN